MSTILELLEKGKDTTESAKNYLPDHNKDCDLSVSVHSKEFNDRVEINDACRLEVESAYNLKKNLNSTLGHRLSFSIWDFGREKGSRNLNHLMMTRKGVYLLVFSLKQMQVTAENEIRNLKFWVDTISFYATDASIALIGTAPETSMDIARVDKLLRSNLKITSRFIINTSDKACFFPVENYWEKGEANKWTEVKGGVENVRHMIEKTALEQKLSDRKIPVRWFICLNALLKSSTTYVSLCQVKSLASQLNIGCGAEVEDMLRFFHDIGLVIYFTNTESLRDIIVVNPEWILKKMAWFFGGQALKVLNMDEINRYGLEADVETLSEKALMTHDLLEYLVNDKHLMPFMLDLLQEALFISKWTSVQSGQTTYLAPNFLRQNETLVPDRKSLRLVFSFKESCLPAGIYHRLVCLSIAYSGVTEESGQPRVSENWSKVWFGNDKYVYFEHNILEPEIIAYVSMDHAKTLSVIVTMMKKITQHSMNSKLYFDLLLEEPVTDNLELEFGKRESSFIPLENARKTKTKPWFNDDIWESSILDRTGSLLELNFQSFLSSLAESSHYT